MASITKDKDGNIRILFTGTDRKRHAVYLGQANRKLAQAVKLRIETLIASLATRTPLDNETATWTAQISDEVAEKLAAVGLIPARVQKQTAGLKDFCNAYVESRPEVAANTRRNLLQATRYLAEFFGADCKIPTVTVGDAVRFASQMRADYAPATANRTIVHAKHFFKAAERDGIIDQNPFRDVKGGTMANPARMHFVTPEQTKQLLDACPNGEWRLIVALARYGGLRTPSEHLVLTWADTDWERGRFLVRSPKTGPRWVPMFPELRPHLDEAFNRAEEGAVHVVTRTRDTSANWRTTFGKIIVKAGLLPWAKPFQNLRATRETELAQSYPLHVVTAWIGNSVPVAAKHYLQVTDADFLRAAKGNAIPVGRSSEVGGDKGDEGDSNDADSDAQPTRNPTQTGADAARHDWTESGETLENQAFCLIPSDPVLSCPLVQYPEKESNLPARLRRPSTAAVGRGKQFSVQESNLSTGLRKPSAAAVGRRVFTRSRFQVPGFKFHVPS